MSSQSLKMYMELLIMQNATSATRACSSCEGSPAIRAKTTPASTTAFFDHCTGRTRRTQFRAAVRTAGRERIRAGRVVGDGSVACTIGHASLNAILRS